MDRSDGFTVCNINIITDIVSSMSFDQQNITI